MIPLRAEERLYTYLNVLFPTYQTDFLITYDQKCLTIKVNGNRQYITIIQYEGGCLLAHEIYGPYQSMNKAVRKANVLGLKGYKADCIKVFAEEKKAENLNKWIDATIIPVPDEQKPLNRDALDADDHLYKKLRQLDFSKGQAIKYYNLIISGAILIVTEDDLRMGNDPTGDTVQLKEHIVS